MVSQQAQNVAQQCSTQESTSSEQTQTTNVYTSTPETQTPTESESSSCLWTTTSVPSTKHTTTGDTFVSTTVTQESTLNPESSSLSRHSYETTREISTMTDTPLTEVWYQMIFTEKLSYLSYGPVFNITGLVPSNRGQNSTSNQVQNPCITSPLSILKLKGHCSTSKSSTCIVLISRLSTFCPSHKQSSAGKM